MSLQIKDLELHNPSKKSIAYTAKLEGHKDFTTEATIVRIEAKSTVRFPIKCMPTTSVPQEARSVSSVRQLCHVLLCDPSCAQ